MENKSTRKVPIPKLPMKVTESILNRFLNKYKEK